MPEPDVPATLADELYQELTGHLLPYWIEHTLDEQHGGFVGQITQEGVVVAGAAKGAVLNARILWTFSAAYRLLGREAYARIADRALDYFWEHFWDHQHEGVFWRLDKQGRPLDAHKQIYAQAFALYGLSEYHRAVGDLDSLTYAVRLFNLIERYGFDPEHGGYIEARSRSWRALDDVRLSTKDLNVPKSMNTNLHVLEAYTNLYRIWPNAVLKERLHALTECFLSTILDENTGHLRLFFDMDWTPRSEKISFGHDIEASWLLMEAAHVLADAGLRARVREAAVATARVTRAEGQDEDGGLFNEVCPGHPPDTDKHWWPQAEAVIGFLNAYQETGDEDFLDAAVKAWTFIRRYVIDRAQGEWFGRLRRDGIPYEGEDKVGLWKCPYHNARACLEVIERAEHVAVLRT